MPSEIVKYSLDNGQDIEVTEQDVRDLLSASGQMAQNVTTQEVKTFMRLCQAQRLNPFTRDAYIVKYGNAPATIITGKEAFTKRAFRHPKFRGMEAGITLVGTDGKLHRRDGSMLLNGETLTGGWCRVYVEGYEKPMFDEVTFGEYSTGKGNWAKIPATMIRKVAITHALREAFPEDLGGLYGEEEMAQAQPTEPTYETDAEIVEVQEACEPPEDPRKALWAESADLKAQAVSAGVDEDDITSWMAESIVNQDGSPKAMKNYAAEDIERLIDFLKSGVQDAELAASHDQVGAEACGDYSAEQTEYATEDIPF